MNKPKVLFLCTGNSARSQMAEAFLRHEAGEYFEAYSAGLEPKGINPFTTQVMEEIGISLEGQTSKDLREYLGKSIFATLVTVCSNADKNCPTTFLGYGERMHWNFDDPAAAGGTDEEKLAKFREIRDQIGRKIRSWLSERGIPVEAGAQGAAGM